MGTKKSTFNDYDSFVDKFRQKKTTDDCFTPREVYDCVVNHVSEICDINGLKIVRPFYPGGDFESYQYPSNCVVIDNPPFSIISKIAKFYVERGIKFFLFAPHLTLFCIKSAPCKIVVGSNLIYENGAIVKTSFITNLFDDIEVMTDPELFIKLKKANKIIKKQNPIYEYPTQLLTVSDLACCAENGVKVFFKKGEIFPISQLDSQKKSKKAIFGKGFLLSQPAAERKSAARELAARQKEVRQARELAARQKEKCIFTLSKREIDIIESLK